jgi:hypothetical protein
MELDNESIMERRQFIRSSCNFCLLTAAGILLSDLSACSPAYQVFRTEVINDEITVPLASFPQTGLQFVRPKGWYYDIAVQKKKMHMKRCSCNARTKTTNFFPQEGDIPAPSMVVSSIKMEK